MATFVISDLHLSFGVNKPMNVFGDKWNNHEERIKEDWLSKVKDSDYVIIAGDISWATYLDEAVEDFAFINNLPGHKIILKGNHDYWWETVTKLNKFLDANNFKSISFLYNNALETDDYVVCGTRYWNDEDGKENSKIFNREIERAKLSLNEGEKIRANTGKKLIMCTHYPPDEKLLEAVKEYKIDLWIYAHIHSNYEDNMVEIPNIPSYLTSCDYLNFKLIKL